ncbi:MAG: histidine kinase, partial [Cyanobacteria bacterium J06623_7]
KLVATPALVKMAPGPRQTLAGSNLIEQLEKWWPQWKGEKSRVNPNDSLTPTAIYGSSSYAKDIRLSDEIFSLQQEKEELEAQLRFKDKILAMLAHDLRTPLTAASMAVETIEISEKNKQLSANKLDKLKYRLFEQAKNQFRIMDNMIGEILQNSQNDNAKLEVHPKPLNLGFLFQEVAAQFEVKLQQKSMEFILDIPQDLPLVYADAELIRQVASNLLDNALKYTPPQGRISLSILHRTNQKVEVSICDTGPGIPVSQQEQIFEGNFRLNRDRDADGYGLGLATCRQIVSAHYGQIWVDGSSKFGSCFRFTLLVYK